ncbi:hypothetical protein RI129_002242 [Pyrocoelia pectoralis]|uniref:Uncharacterized protein n=1 Tax=Pyrocoelia pectoralis TaxID=417401 RepID=A0AAN7VEY4_9COLE
MSKNLYNFTDETLLTTPKPRASSTIQKEQFVKHKAKLQIIPFAFSPDAPDQSRTSTASTASLGILNLDDVKLNSFINDLEVAQIDRKSSLDDSKELRLPSRYFKPSDGFTNSTCDVTSDSTVNESDLINKQKLSFKPDDISTPRSSSTVPDYRTKHSIMRQITSKSIAELSYKIRNSNVSLAEACNQYCRRFSFSNEIEINEESFIPGELAGDKIAEQEMLWRKELSVLGGVNIRGDSILSQCGVQDPLSISDFFHKGSELAELVLKKSPDRKEAPIPLIDKTLEDSSLEIGSDMKSSLGVTELEENFSLQDDTAKLMDLIAKMPERKSSKRSKQAKENLRPEKQEKSYSLGKSENIVKVGEPLKDSQNFSQELTYQDNTNFIHTGSSSVHTASSLESLPGGKLPIETNRIELVWGCVRLGKKKSQNFILRNRAQNKLRLQITSSNSCFRILSDNSDMDSISDLSVFMHPSESRSFKVVFMPTSIGATVGELRFSPTSTKLQMQYQKKQVLHLYGYGGYASVEIQDVSKDTNMKMWLSLGKLDNISQLHKKFNIRNVGNVSAFAFLKFTSKALYQSSKLAIYPTEIVVHPKESAVVNLTYSPTKEDVKHLFALTNHQVKEIGSIQVVTGAEVLRGRIRRLCKKLKMETGKVENPLIEQLSKKFPNEKMPNDLNYFKETVGCVKELMQTFDLNEITVTLERDTDRTLVGQIGGMDESSMFHSLCERMNTEIDGKLLTSSCVVEPCSIILTPPTKMTDTVLVISNSNKCLQFQTTIEPPGMLDVFPVEGILSARETVLIKISCDLKKLHQKYFKLSVYVDDDVSEVDIKVIILKLD